MGITYSEEIFRKHAEKAIKSADEIKVGDTLYSNSWLSPEFEVAEVLTDAEHYRRVGLDNEGRDDIAPRWLQADKANAFRAVSLHDRNIGAHYNPWLLFKSKEDRDACVSELKTGYEPDPLDDYEFYDGDDCHVYEDA